MKEGFYEDLKGMLVALTLMTMAVCMLILIRQKKPLTDTDMLKIMALTLYFCPLMLPNMHERYDYTAIMACLAVACLDWRTIPYLLIFMQVNLRTYGDFLFGNNPNWVFLSVANISSFALYFRNCAKGIRNGEGDLTSLPVSKGADKAFKS